MRDDLLLYYERELTYLRRMGAEFAARYPKVASRLQLEPTKCEDPHVERLLEGFAFLAARVHHRLDDDLPEVSEAMLEVLHPQHVRPLPSLSLVELELDPELGKLPAGFHVPRGSELRSRPVQGMPCRFRTCYDTTLWPMTVTGAEWTTADRAGAGRARGRGGRRHPHRAARVQRHEARPARPSARTGRERTVSGRRDSTSTRSACISPATPTSPTRCTSCCSTVAHASSSATPTSRRARPSSFRPPAVTPVGFEENEALLPYPRRTFAGYSLLQELFAFPQKFQFVDVAGVAEALRALGAGVACRAVLRHRAVRARRTAPDPGARDLRADVPPRVHPGREPVRAGGRADPAHATDDGVRRRTRRAAPARDRDVVRGRRLRHHAGRG